MKTWAHFGTYVTELSGRLKDARQSQEEERIQINDTKALILSSMNSEDSKSAEVCFTFCMEKLSSLFPIQSCFCQLLGGRKNINV